MKKYLPFILLGLGVIFVVAAVFVVKSRNNSNGTGEEEKIVELPVELRPYTQLVPGKDGHRLVLKINNISVPGAVSMDYELLYQTSDGRPQGVPGLVDLEGVNNFERELLLGSESSGVERYDEGVEEGTLTLKFRDDNGKFLGKVSTDFHLISGTTTLDSVDGKFTYKLDDKPDDVFFVVMQTFGLPTGYKDGWDGVSYGVFASVEDKYPGSSSGWDNILKDGSVGVFVASS